MMIGEPEHTITQSVNKGNCFVPRSETGTLDLDAVKWLALIAGVPLSIGAYVVVWLLSMG